MAQQYKINGYGRAIEPVIIGSGKPKLITVIGTTDKKQERKEERQKAKCAYKYGASIIADVSTEGNISDFQKEIMDTVPIPLSTVPIYEIRQRAIEQNIWLSDVPKNFILDIITEQA
jgi:thiamine biosynthesis protein ThiC